MITLPKWLNQRQSKAIVHFTSKLGLAFSIVSIFAMAPAQADKWPERVVKIITPSGPGGQGDVYGRLLANELSIIYKQTFIVESIAGAGGIIGAGEVARAPADGYTLLITGPGPILTGPAVNPASVKFDAVRDFVHIGVLAGDSYWLLASPGSGFKTLADAVKASKQVPLSTATPGPGTFGDILVRQLTRFTDLKLQGVPYRGAGEVTISVLGNQTPLGMQLVSQSSEFVRSGKAVALAIAQPERNPAFSDVPTFGESGMQGIDGRSWLWIAGPANIPSEIVTSLNREIQHVIELPNVHKRLEADNLPTWHPDPAALQKYVSDELIRQRALVKQLDISGN